jgi:hypothetical protein
LAVPDFRGCPDFQDYLANLDCPVFPEAGAESEERPAFPDLQAEAEQSEFRGAEFLEEAPEEDPAEAEARERPDEPVVPEAERPLCTPVVAEPAPILRSPFGSR